MAARSDGAAWCLDIESRDDGVSSGVRCDYRCQRRCVGN
jgi:hypothetical protein